MAFMIRWYLWWTTLNVRIFLQISTTANHRKIACRPLPILFKKKKKKSVLAEFSIYDTRQYYEGKKVKILSTVMQNHPLPPNKMKLNKILFITLLNPSYETDYSQLAINNNNCKINNLRMRVPWLIFLQEKSSPNYSNRSRIYFHTHMHECVI